MPGTDKVGNTDEPDKSSGLKHGAFPKARSAKGSDQRNPARLNHFHHHLQAARRSRQRAGKSALR